MSLAAEAPPRSQAKLFGGLLDFFFLNRKYPYPWREGLEMAQRRIFFHYHA